MGSKIQEMATLEDAWKKINFENFFLNKKIYKYYMEIYDIHRCQIHGCEEFDNYTNMKSFRLRKSLLQMLPASIVIRSESGAPITTPILLECGRRP